VIEKVKELVEKQSESGNQSRMAYYYFSFDEPSTHEVDSLLKSLLIQLTYSGDIPPELVRLYKSHVGKKPSWRELRNVLFSILRRANKEDNDDRLSMEVQDSHFKDLYFIFDGLDEIPSGSPRNSILLLISQLHASTSAQPRRIHTILASRKERNIADKFPISQGWVHQAILPSAVEFDISLFISSQIEELPNLQSLPEKSKNKIKSKLIQGSNGM
jgi:hypothetical protein